MSSKTQKTKAKIGKWNYQNKKLIHSRENNKQYKTGGKYFQIVYLIRVFLYKIIRKSATQYQENNNIKNMANRHGRTFLKRRHTNG
jgi:hypothetical protein